MLESNNERIHAYCLLFAACHSAIFQKLLICAFLINRYTDDAHTGNQDEAW